MQRPDLGKRVGELDFLGRRPFFCAAAAMLAFSGIADAWGSESIKTIDLWPGSPPGGGGPSGSVRTTPQGAVDHVAVPCLRIYRPKHPNGRAVLVAGGGGYRHINLRHESIPAALWLAAHGITAFVLVYRLPGEGWQNGPCAPFQDAQRAIRLIRARAGQWGIATDHVGVLGFSAGGHLMGLAADWFDFHSYAPVDSVDFLSARPDNAALIYPVITLEPPYQQTSTRAQMVGQNQTKRMSAEWSVQTHVRPNCPPIFLVQAKDDPVSNAANSIIMAKACQRAGVSVVLHQPATGGHGFGMGRAGTPTAAWPLWYAHWLERQGMIKI